MLQILGVGLPRTGTASLAAALTILGYKTERHAPERLPLPRLDADSFKAYDDLDAIVDAPACIFYEEITRVYQPLKCILTVRAEDAWWKSIRTHTWRVFKEESKTHVRYTGHLHALLFGWPTPQNYLYRKAYRDHNRNVRRDLPAADLLEFDVTCGKPWPALCAFLGKDVPNVPFPWENRLVSEEGTP